MGNELDQEQQRAWLTLLRAPGIGAATLRELVAQHGDAARAIAAARRDSTSGALRAAIAASDDAAIERDLAWLAQPRHYLIPCTSADFPALLRDIANAPAALFVDGDPACLWSAQIAIVGARSASAPGLGNARSFAKAFAQAGLTVTSGMAEGIDGAAHMAALEAGGSTIAVLGTGPDLIYPRQHGELAQRIAQHGALVSEFPPGTPGKPEHFPRRNRIISGLSLGTLVIEASLNSGSLITARLAAEQGREVFALPGSIHSPLARGCHKLIRDGAKLVETAADVLDDLHGIGGVLAARLRERLTQLPAAPESAADTHAGDPDYVRLLAALDHTPAALDELIARSGLAPGAISSMLLVLELEGAVCVGSGRYSRAV